MLQLLPPQGTSPGIHKSLLGNSTRPELQPGFRPRILALHGARSNSSVTKLQLENLRITEDEYDIVYMNGQIELEEGDPDIIGFVHGPFYSWIDEKEGGKLGPSLIAAVRSILIVAKTNGPFDGIYGFSQGGTLAALVTGIGMDLELQKAILNQRLRKFPSVCQFIE